MRMRTTMWETPQVNKRNFIAVDGEGIDDKYVLLADSTGNHSLAKEGLSTHLCFDYLLSILRPPQSVLVGFFFTYDINMMLRDMGKRKLVKLWKEKWVYWQGYQLEWTPTKSFTVSKETTGQKVTVYDVGGFFQSSFVTALRKWEAAPPEVIERIEQMKQQRDTFDDDTIPSMIQYCLEE